MFRTAAQNFTVAAQNIVNLREDFHNLLMVMKTSMMDGLIKCNRQINQA